MPTVLVFDVNWAIMQLSMQHVRHAGHGALCATGVETGLLVTRGKRPDLIYMDLPLPRTDGLAATAVLKHDPAATTKVNEESCRSAGCDAHIVKPLRFKEPCRLMEHILWVHTPPAASAVSPGSR